MLGRPRALVSGEVQIGWFSLTHIISGQVTFGINILDDKANATIIFGFETSRTLGPPGTRNMSVSTAGGFILWPSLCARWRERLLMSRCAAAECK